MTFSYSSFFLFFFNKSSKAIKQTYQRARYFYSNKPLFNELLRYLFMQQVFIKSLLCAKHWFSGGDTIINNEKKPHTSPNPFGVHSLVGLTGNKWGK